MKTITSGIKSWKTTAIGVALAVLIIMQEQTDLANWQDWVFPALIAALGILSRDANKTSENSGVTPLIILSLVATFFFTSCDPATYTVNTVPYGKAIEANPGAVTIKKEDVIPNGGFQLDVGGTVVTDQGEINIGNGGISTDVVIDLRSGK